MKIIFIKYALLMGFVLACGCGKNDKGTMPNPALQAGQVWTYYNPINNSSNEVLRIVSIETNHPVVVYVWMMDSKQEYNFIPFSYDAIQRSVLDLTATNFNLTSTDRKYFQEFLNYMHQGVKAGDLEPCFNTNLPAFLVMKKAAGIH